MITDDTILDRLVEEIEARVAAEAKMRSIAVENDELRRVIDGLRSAAHNYVGHVHGRRHVDPKKRGSVVEWNKTEEATRCCLMDRLAAAARKTGDVHPMVPF